MGNRSSSRHSGSLLRGAEAISLTIGELAVRRGVSVEAIRYYEREGVIPRAARGGPGRYRRRARAIIRQNLAVSLGLIAVATDCHSRLALRARCAR
jgi:hypothetical protein